MGADFMQNQLPWKGRNVRRIKTYLLEAPGITQRKEAQKTKSHASTEDDVWLYQKGQIEEASFIAPLIGNKVVVSTTSFYCCGGKSATVFF